MPLPLFVPVILIAGATVAISLLVWSRMMKWAYQAVLPWIKTRLPAFAPFAESAYVVLVKTTTYSKAFVQGVIDAWRGWRQRLLKQEIKVKRTTDGAYVQQVTSWIYEPEKGDNHITRTELPETPVHWDDLPFETKRDLMHADEAGLSVAKQRDAEIDRYEEEYLTMTS